MLRTTVTACLLTAPLLLVGAHPALAQGETEGRVKLLPEWSVSKEMKELQQRSASLIGVVNSLGRANEELKTALERYMEDPRDTVRASQLELKLASHGQRILTQFDVLLVEQDGLQASFKGVRRKLGGFGAVLEHKVGESRKTFEAVRGSMQSHERELIRLAVQIREEPPEDPALLQQLKERFRELHMEFAIKQRRVRDVERHLRSRQKLASSFQRLEQIFEDLHTKFGWLVENLAAEREYLHNSIELQKETLQMKELVRGVISDGDGSLGGVTDRLADAFLHVDRFQAIQERLAENLNGFVDHEAQLQSLSSKVEGIFGESGAMPSAKDIDAVIGKFYEKAGG